MNELLLTAPIAFIVLFLVSGLVYFLIGNLSAGTKNVTEGQGRPYACGEEQAPEAAIADYGQFFPFAFFFTLLDVAALTVSTFLAVTPGSLVVGVLYVVSALVGLIILYRS